MEDHRIIELYFARDEEAVRYTAEKYGGYCYRIANNVLNNRESAEEVVNDTYAKAWNSIPPTKPISLSAYLGKIARNLSLNVYRSLHSEKRGSGEVPAVLEELGEFVASRESTEGSFDRRELARVLNAFLGNLPETERDVFVARYWFIAPIEEICDRFSFSESKVKSMLFRTRKKLLAYLQKEELI